MDESRTQIDVVRVASRRRPPIVNVEKTQTNAETLINIQLELFCGFKRLTDAVRIVWIGQ